MKIFVSRSRKEQRTKSNTALNVAVDLSWVRHEKVGGSESAIKNLLKGLKNAGSGEIHYTLLVSRNNVPYFKEYESLPQIRMLVCDVNSENQHARVLWQNTKMGQLLRKEGIHLCYEPVYNMPVFHISGIRFVTTIHDLQALHFPEYFSRSRLLWFQFSWKNTIRRAVCVTTISHSVEQDIKTHFPIENDRIRVVYDAIDIDRSADPPEEEQSRLEEKYHVRRGAFYFTVSSLLPHKNLLTLVRLLEQMKQQHSSAFLPLTLSGVGGPDLEQLQEEIQKRDLSDSVFLTPFISDAERNALYRMCRAFLFPSLFEGFGMPPVEALASGTPVVTTREASIPEATGNLAYYVKNPMDVNEWQQILEGPLTPPDPDKVQKLMDRYRIDRIVRQYEDIFREIGEE